MASSSNDTPRAVTTDYILSEGGQREDFSVEDEYIYDDYDFEPLLSSHGDMEFSRQYQGRKYSLLRPNDTADASTVIPIKCRTRRCVWRIFIALLLCGFGGLCGYLITEKYDKCSLATRDFHSFHKQFVLQTSSKNIEQFFG